MEQITDIGFWWKVLSDPAHLGIVILVAICFWIYHTKLIKPKVKKIWEHFGSMPDPKEKILTDAVHQKQCNAVVEKVETMLDRKFSTAELLRKEDLDKVADITLRQVEATNKAIDKLAASVNILLDHALNGVKK